MHLTSQVLLLSLVAAGSTPDQPKNDVNDNICTDPADSTPRILKINPCTPLQLARKLHVPLATETNSAEFEHASFWDDNGPLLQDAWNEWETNNIDTDVALDLIDPTLSMALDSAFANPTEETESNVKSLWTSSTIHDIDQSSLPFGVYAIQLLTPPGIARIRHLLDMAASSGIPTRRPNGMNRNGVIVDSNVNGAVPIKSLVQLVEEEIINRVVRPVGRMLFPDRVGCNDDVEYFAFTIQYDGSDDDDDGSNGNEKANSKDFELKEHRDASVVTLNINLNLPDEEGYHGSEVYFRGYPSEESTNNKHDGGSVRFSPGMSIIHLGAHRHGSLPISASSSSTHRSGKRYNLVIWLFGEHGDVRIAPYEKEEQMNVIQRWHGCNNHTQRFAFE